MANRPRGRSCGYGASIGARGDRLMTARRMPAQTPLRSRRRQPASGPLVECSSGGSGQSSRSATARSNSASATSMRPSCSMQRAMALSSRGFCKGCNWLSRLSAASRAFRSHCAAGAGLTRCRATHPPHVPERPAPAPAGCCQPAPETTAVPALHPPVPASESDR